MCGAFLTVPRGSTLRMTSQLAQLLSDDEDGNIKATRLQAVVRLFPNDSVTDRHFHRACDGQFGKLRYGSTDAVAAEAAAGCDSPSTCRPSIHQGA